MRVPIIDIGNSKGIRIPQAILKQTLLGDEIDMEVTEGKIILKRARSQVPVPDFSAISELDDTTIQQMLRKINGADLITSLIGADQAVKEALYRNLSKRVRDYIEPKVEKLERGDVRDLIIERSRNVLSETLMEVCQE